MMGNLTPLPAPPLGSGEALSQYSSENIARLEVPTFPVVIQVNAVS